MDSEWLLWGLKSIIYILFWAWPWYYVTWPLMIITIVSARSEYKKTGGGFRGAMHATYFAIRSLPSTANALARFVVSQFIMIYGLLSRTDAMKQVPGSIRIWLGHGAIEKQIVEVEKIVYRDRGARTLKSRLFLRVRWMIVGALLLLVGQNWQTIYKYAITWTSQ